MLMARIRPARRRNRHQIVRKVHENVHQVPMPDRISSRVIAALDPSIVDVAPHHVVAHQDPAAVRQCGCGGREGDGGLVEGIVEGFEVGAGLEVGDVGDWVGDWGRGFRWIEGGIWRHFEKRNVGLGFGLLRFGDL